MVIYSVTMARIMWHSVAPWTASGYGTQTAIWITKLQELGHEVIVSTYWGLNGSPTSWNGITVLPGFGDGYCSDSLLAHFTATKSDFAISLCDVWVLRPDFLAQLPIAHWLPSDCRPMSGADFDVAKQSGSQLIAMSKFGKERFTEAGFDPLYIPHGIDTDTFKPLDRDAIREELGIGDRFVIGMNAANNDAIRKGIPEQMLAFARFHGQHPDSVMLVHSAVQQQGGQNLNHIVESLNLQDSVRFTDQYSYLAGVNPPEVIAQWYNALDVLTSASFGEGFGLPIVEAQACGTPAVVTDASSMTELNPEGWTISGQPFWNGVHRGWWTTPSIGEIRDAYVSAYEEKASGKAEGRRKRVHDFAQNYSVERVLNDHFIPALEEIPGRVARG